MIPIKIINNTKNFIPIAILPAGFPSPADDYIDRGLDLNELLIKHPSATYFVRVEGDSMINAGISQGDILIVDRAVEPRNNSIVIAVLNNEFTVKRVRFLKNKIQLIPENENYSIIEIDENQDFEIWGTVVSVIKKIE